SVFEELWLQLCTGSGENTHKLIYCFRRDAKLLEFEHKVVKLVLNKSATGHNVMEPVDIS
ncbi:MAG: hypothetical protein ACKPKO_57495, partial [Candidatus Fonsibacter sp.]